MSCETCEFSPVYNRGETLKFTVDILVWNGSAYEGVDTLVGWDAHYILRQGDTVIEFLLSDTEISTQGDYTFLVSIAPEELSSLEPGKVEHEFITTDTSGTIRVVFSSVFTVKTSLLWETL